MHDLRDLDLGRRLVTGAVTPDELARLTDGSIARRSPYFGAIAALVEHADPALRAAAVRALAGARGVPGVRTLVGRLDDDDAGVRAAALEALRATARDAPVRYAHALFHPRAEVRRAALADVPRGAVDQVAYLRGDPACAELAALAPWPADPLPLAFDLHANGMPDAELVERIVQVSNSDLRAFLVAERGRSPQQVDAYLEDLAQAATWTVAPGTDVIDQIFTALDGAGDAAHALDRVVETVTPRKERAFTRRATVSLLSHFARRGAASPALIGACCALEPRVIGLAGFDPAHAGAAAAGLVRFRWPVRPLPAQVERLLELPVARGDLAVAAALAGLFGARRLARLVKSRGEPAILDALIAGDRGWDEVCALPDETPSLELGWLTRIDKLAPERYVALAARALAAFAGKRLERFVDQLPRRRRHEVLIRLLARADLAAEDPRIGNACRVIAPRLDTAGLGAVLEALLAATAGPRGGALALALARAVDDKQLTAAGRELSDPAVARFVTLLDGDDPLPRGRELAIAQAFVERADLAVQEWARRVSVVAQVTAAAALPPVRVRIALDDKQRARIASCTDRELAGALAPAMAGPATGLVAALAARVAVPHVAACVALLGCADPIDDVARQLDRFAQPTRGFDDDLDRAVSAIWHSVAELPPLAHARMFRWEAHNHALARWLESAGGVLPALSALDALPGWLAAQTLWAGIAEVMVFLRYRDPVAFRREATAPVAELAAARLDRPIGRHAARILISIIETGAVPASAVLATVLDRAADADADTRDFIRRIARLDGMPPPPPPVDRTAPPAELIDEVRATEDLDALVAWCGHTRYTVVQEAVLALVLRGAEGQARLAGLLPRLGELPAPVPLIASIGLWDEGPALDAARALAASGELRPQWRFHLALGTGNLTVAFEAARDPDPGWFVRADWDALVRVADPVWCAIELAGAPHHHAYRRAIAVLLENEGDFAGAFHRFLEVSMDRPIQLRRDVARRLIADHGDLVGLPILIEEVIDPKTTEGFGFLDRLTAHAGTAVAQALVDAALIGGDGACSERQLWRVLEHLRGLGRVDPGVLSGLHVRVLEEASSAEARRAAGQLAVGAGLGHERLRRVAEVFAWGVRRGVELTGRLMHIHLTSAERDLGHTYLESSRIFVSALPLLRDEPNGRDVVEGLILHELGHHVYHRGELEQALWKQAHAEGIGHLLNLIADEHLERNLRAVDRGYGDRLKRLDAYAFQHAPQEIALATLLRCLRGSAARALIAADLGVAFHEAAVRLRRGAVIGELDRNGHPLARFARALRMGLGNRHADPVVARALELCKDVRHLGMRGLYELTHQLAALFGGAISVASVFGGPEGLSFGEREDDVFGAGVDDEILQREVERILDPRRGGKGPLGARDHLCINVNPDERFERISTVVRVAGNREVHRRIAGQVTRHAARLRGLLDDLGLRWEPAKARTAGRALDRGRLRALVTRGDPRILIARTPVRRTDLFLGTVIDCSGSMQAGDNIERARRFAVLISEAVRPLAGVDARFFGFTESVIYDAGDAHDCGVTALEADGGNNDAAALFHAANVAAASRRRAKVLVMISDGLPTQCSVAAVRGLVTTLTRRRNIVCAQVAVRRLDEVMFPHHLVLDDDQIEVSVARFGRLIAELAQRGLAS